MRCDTCITSSSDKTLATLDCNMLTCLEISEPFCQSKVDDINSLAIFSAASHEVVGLDVSVNKTFPMNLLESCDYLDSDVESS